jgi:hypothetical protein
MSFSTELISLAFSGIAGLVWLVRLEGRIIGALDKIRDLSSQVTNQEKKHEALDNRIMEKLSFIERSLAKIEGQLIIRRDHEQ